MLSTQEAPTSTVFVDHTQIDSHTMTSTNTAEKTWDEYVAAAKAHPAPPARSAAKKMVKKVQADQSTKDAVEFFQ